METDAALSSLIELVRQSRQTLLYHYPTDDGGLEHARALAAAASASASADDVVVVFDAGSEMRLPDLFLAIEEAVLEAKPQAPLAPPMAGPVQAMLAWQEALGLRFMLLFYRFDAVLDHPDQEFDDMLLQLVRDPALNLCLLLLMDETAAPRLQRLHAHLPELGEDYLRMPDALAPLPVPQPAIEPAPAPTRAVHIERNKEQEKTTAVPLLHIKPVTTAPSLVWPDANLAQDKELAPSDRPRDFLASQGGPPSSVETISPLPLFWPLPESEGQEDLTQPVLDEAAKPPVPHRRRRAFPSFLDQAEPGLANDAAVVDTPFTFAPQPEQMGELTYREQRPLPVSAWMQKRQSRRRRAILATATSTGMASTVLFFFMLVLALVCWELPLLS